MKIKKATRRYEAWLGEHTTLVAEELEHKHRLMADGPLPFLRATFYRWAQVFPEACHALVAMPEVLAVGDLHVDAFGTWRDDEGRLVWGVRDLDEAYPLPFTSDLVRLATSAELAARASRLSLDGKAACDAILAGYVDALDKGGAPFVLDGRFPWLRQLLDGAISDPARFWSELDALPSLGEALARAVSAAIARMMPPDDLEYRVVRGASPVGSLGRQRYVAIADWRGGHLAREATPAVPSAAAFAAEDKDDHNYAADLIKGAVRSGDPWVAVTGGWKVRRLAPDCTPVEVTTRSGHRDEGHVLHAMGFEAGNLHLGTRGAGKDLRKALRKLPPGWLHEATQAMTRAVTADWEAWKHRDSERESEHDADDGSKNES